ncbi:MAG: hypothetical protein HYV36_08520 [Lentisphaerae bacterium]|nr:hypothetical protein [Lentisphaerota bacterium]
MDNGKIDVDGKGYMGAPSGSAVPGSGPGGGDRGVSGAGHGGGGGYGGRGGSSGSGGGTGYGSVATGSAPYGAAATPDYPGSGGGAYPAQSGAGGAGGGLIRIEAIGAVLVDGAMSANGAAGGATYGGGGSGGGIYIECGTFSGGGSLNAIGGSNTNGGGGGGGGGRIAVIYDLTAQSGTNNPTGLFSAARGTATWQNGDIGTLYFADTRFLSTTMRHVGQLLSFTNAWSVSSLLLTNSWLRFPQEGLRLTVTGGVVMVGTSRLDIGGNSYVFGVIPSTYYRYTLFNTNTAAAVFSVGGDVSLAGNCAIYLYAGHTNATTPDYSLLMSVTGDVSIASNAWIYPVSQITNGGASVLRMSNLMVAAGGGFNANGQGYWGRTASGEGFGPGGGGRGISGIWGAGGGGYGGTGGSGASGSNGAPYGLPEAPLQPGSCGGAWSATYLESGIGGGLIRIVATNTVTNNGTLTANCIAGAAYTGGGSGGGIYIQCKSFTGGGSLYANGGGSASSASGGGGGGGRIAVIYDPAAQDTMDNPTGVFSAAGATPSGFGVAGDIGTLYFPDARFLSTNMAHSGQWMAPSFTNWGASSLLLTNNSWLRFPQEGFRLTITGSVMLVGTSRLDIGPSASFIGPRFLLYNTGAVASVFSVGGNVSLATGCVLRLYGAHTNATTPDYGLLMSVTGDVSIASNAYLYSISQITNGGSPLMRVGNLTVDIGGNLSADGFGFTSSRGPGAGGSSGGGGYGGQGGGANGGSAYGNSNAPVEPGSSGGPPGTYAAAGYAGGLIRLQATDTVRINGTVSANPTRSLYYADTPGASGGGIYLTCRAFQGSTNGLLRANGGVGAGTGSCGGGGRIAVWRIYETSSGAVSTSVNSGGGGVGGTNGVAGTVVWGWLPAPGTIFSFK